MRAADGFPGFNALRVPARFWMITTLCLAVIGAVLFDRLALRLGVSVRRGRRGVAGGAGGRMGHRFSAREGPEVWTVENAAFRRLMELPLGDPSAMWRPYARCPMAAPWSTATADIFLPTTRRFGWPQPSRR
jgi:hypothetical protein